MFKTDSQAAKEAAEGVAEMTVTVKVVNKKTA